MKKGLLVIISAPSGGGKDTVIDELIKRIPNSGRLVNTTTRSPRPGEKNEVNYHFISVEEFEKRIENDKFLEHNFYAGNYYGTEKDVLEKTLQKYSVVFSNIEVNGKHNLDKQGIHNLSIFLDPESMEILKSRIEKRGGIDQKFIAERLKIAYEEIEKSKDYDYHLVNGEGRLENVVKNVENFIEKTLKNLPNANS